MDNIKTKIMEESGEKYFLEVFTSLMVSCYPECLVEENSNKNQNSKKNIFRLDSKNMVIEVYRTSFYFLLNPSITRKVKEFSVNDTWYVRPLKFNIQLTASTGKTYSYPELRDYLGNDKDDILMTATYVFSCVNFTIKFFESGLQELNSQKIKGMVSKPTKTITEIK
ncbi:hypothetical protein [Psychroserpens jangbogonensis]|uniref:hypothetical protein n=1 Tax=Psychroserpens jangbogonensis TaxID=1484460 RepID=UPI00053D7FA6|nr:hypothetical protein [Psychroserpens jangbogonensis]